MPTCYAEYSRADGATCTEDRQCQSHACNTERGMCRATVGTLCTLELGCGPSPGGERVVCASMSNGDRRCTLTQGEVGEPCAANADCVSGLCTAERCACVPDCAGRSCGDDGCGGECGSCGSLGRCDATGQCGCLNDNEIFCDGMCVGWVDTDRCGACDTACMAPDRCSESMTQGHPVCQSDVYYAPQGSESLSDCDAVCQRNGYARCAPTPSGGCSTYMGLGCICERDPS